MISAKAIGVTGFWADPWPSVEKVRADLCATAS
jgi:hypothetical protein